MKIRSNITMWLCRNSIYANQISFNIQTYGEMRPDVISQYILKYIKR